MQTISRRKILDRIGSWDRKQFTQAILGEEYGGSSNSHHHTMVDGFEAFRKAIMILDDESLTNLIFGEDNREIFREIEYNRQQEYDEGRYLKEEDGDREDNALQKK